MRCRQEIYGHIDCERDALDGEDFCRFHLPGHLRSRITSLLDAVMYMESQLRYIRNISKDPATYECADFTLKKYEEAINNGFGEVLKQPKKDPA